MGNYLPSSQRYANRVGFEDVQKAIFELSTYCMRHRMPLFHTWSLVDWNQWVHVLEKDPPKWMLINTLPDTPDEQACILPCTLSPSLEETVMNWFIQHKTSSSVTVILYGKHTCDPEPEQKYRQCLQLGFQGYIYVGGLFEWLLLQDIYGNGRKEDSSSSMQTGQSAQSAQSYLFTDCSCSDEIEFPTTTLEMDMLRFRPPSLFTPMLTN